MSPPAGQAWWTDETTDSFTVGWASEAEYVISVDETPTVAVRLGPASETYASLSYALSILPLALPLFDLEPFHGSVVEHEDRVLAFLADSGIGKSTMAATFRGRGARLIADDACAVDEHGRVWPGPPLVAPRVEAGAEGDGRETYDGKQVVRLEGHPSAPREPSAVVVLERAPVPASVEPLSGRDGLQKIFRYVRAPWALPVRRADLQLHTVARLATLPILLVTFDGQLTPPEDLADLVLSRLQTLT